MTRASVPSGSQPRARAVGTSTATWMSSTTSTIEILAAMSRGRPSGVEPRRLSTPYWRSNPVPMPRLTMAVDITARARMPGVRNCTEWSTPSGLGSTSTSEKKTSNSQRDGDADQELFSLAQAEGQLHASLGGVGPHVGEPPDGPLGEPLDGRPARALGASARRSARPAGPRGRPPR